MSSSSLQQIDSQLPLSVIKQSHSIAEQEHLVNIAIHSLELGNLKTRKA
jgi:hypothetical protein